jgi:hypothetical protein
MINHVGLILPLVGLLLGGVASGGAPAQRGGSVQRFVSEEALKNLACVTRWEQICAADHARSHQLELHRAQVRYLAWPDGDTSYAIVGKRRKVLQLAPQGSRKAVASVKVEKDAVLYTGPDNIPRECDLPNCADVPECVPPKGDVTVRFVSESRLSERLRELMPLVPDKKCPAGKLEYTPPQAGESCLNTGKPYAPGASRKPNSVSLDLEALRLFLPDEERSRLQNESRVLTRVMEPFYASRLARRSKPRGTLTVRLSFPAGSTRPPEVIIQQDGPRDAELSKCLSAALRSREVFPWRPAKITDLELSFVFGR